MDKKNGFTFIELLGVILLIGIVALIAVPAVNDIIQNSKQKALDKQMDTIFDSARNWAVKNIDLLPEDNGSILVKLETLKEKGFLENKEIINPVSEEELDACVKITHNVSYNQYDYEYSEECIANNSIIKTEHACLTNGTTCPTGEKFAIEVAPGNIQNFYVINDLDNTLTLIMDRNIGDTVAWGESKVEGPITALNYLESQTSNWTNISTKTYSLTDSIYGTITRPNARTRMLTHDEAIDSLECVEYNAGCPTWLYENLSSDSTPYGFWLSSASVGDANYAWLVSHVGYVHSTDVTFGSNYGVRPVIEISKSNIVY